MSPKLMRLAAPGGMLLPGPDCGFDSGPTRQSLERERSWGERLGDGYLGHESGCHRGPSQESDVLLLAGQQCGLGSRIGLSHGSSKVSCCSGRVYHWTPCELEELCQFFNALGEGHAGGAAHLQGAPWARPRGRGWRLWRPLRCVPAPRGRVWFGWGMIALHGLDRRVRQGQTSARRWTCPPLKGLQAKAGPHQIETPGKGGRLAGCTAQVESCLASPCAARRQFGCTRR